MLPVAKSHKHIQHVRYLKRVLFYIVLVAVLAAAFMAYLQPSFILDLANRVILCF